MAVDAERGTKPPIEFVYGLLEDTVVALPRPVLEGLAAQWEAARSSKTWGEYRGHASAEDVLHCESVYRDDDEPVPGDDAPFDMDRDIPGRLDGLWPDWTLFRMLSDLPEEVRNDVGRGGTWILSGDYYDIDREELEALVAAFERHGYVCTRDDDLVARASGM